MGKQAKARAARSNGEKAQAAQIMIVTVPDDIDLKTRRYDAAGLEVVRAQSFFDFLADDVLGQMGKTVKEARRNQEILDLFEDAGPGDRVEIQRAWWNELADVLKKDGWNPYMARQILPFFDAIENAREREASEVASAKPAPESTAP